MADSQGPGNNGREGYRSRREHLVIGLMSGTSLDGVDAALVRILTEADGSVSKVSLLQHTYLPYSPEVRAVVARLCTLEGAKLDDLVYAHFGLSEWYAAAVAQVLAASGKAASQIDAISMHGQTIWHAPQPRAFPGPGGDLPVKGTLQIGSAAVVAERTGIPVIGDLRARDMAAGGEGAPLAPYIDALLFGSPTEGRIVQNIGGIGNATVVPAAATMADILAFDTGPGNMIMDAVVAIGTQGRENYDASGRYAAQGKVDRGAVEALMADPYFSRLPPKSTGREVYGMDFSKAFYEAEKAKGLSFHDIVATATAFTAESIARAYKDFILPKTPIARVLVAGGGALNPSLLSMLAQGLVGIVVESSASQGVPDQAREAMAFALLGHESLMGRPSNLPAVTGARRPVVLGNLTL